MRLQYFSGNIELSYFLKTSIFVTLKLHFCGILYTTSDKSQIYFRGHWQTLYMGHGSLRFSSFMCLSFYMSYRSDQWCVNKSRPSQRWLIKNVFVFANRSLRWSFTSQHVSHYIMLRFQHTFLIFDSLQTLLKTHKSNTQMYFCLPDSIVDVMQKTEPGRVHLQNEEDFGKRSAQLLESKYSIEKWPCTSHFTYTNTQTHTHTGKPGRSIWVMNNLNNTSNFSSSSLCWLFKFTSPFNVALI